MLKIISGGQTGADQAGWRAAKACGLETGGWMPRGFLTEDGPRPELAERYGAREHSSATYRDRTIANLEIADMTLLFGDPRSPGSRLVIQEAGSIHHPVLHVRTTERYPPSVLVDILRLRQWEHVHVLNIAGNRESKAPGIGKWVENYLLDVFAALGHPRVSNLDSEEVPRG